jgi:bisanhydrobacterioruberin hydratase
MRVWANPLHLLLVACFGSYVVLYPGSLFVLSFSQVPPSEAWVGGALIILQGLTCGLWLCANHGWRGAAAALSTLLLSFGVEHLGVTTGAPFGAYSYTEALVPKVLGHVPLAIPFAWLLVVVAALETARFIQHAGVGGVASGPWLAAGGATLALLTDILLEPVVTLVNGYWVWLDRGNYYGVPLTNFAAWWGTGLLLIGITVLLTQRSGPARVLPALPIWLYLLSTIMFTAVNLAYGHIAAAAIGGLLLAYLLFCRCERRLVRWVLAGRYSDIRHEA